MNEYLKHPVSFYVLNMRMCNGNFSEIWKNLEFRPMEDIVIISVRNAPLCENLRWHIQAKVEKCANRNNLYKFVNPNFKFEKSFFIIMIKGDLYEDIKNVYCKSVNLCVRNAFGKTYKKIMRRYFDHFMAHKLSRWQGDTGRMGRIEMDGGGETQYDATILNNHIQIRIGNNTYYNSMSRHFDKKEMTKTSFKLLAEEKSSLLCGNRDGRYNKKENCVRKRSCTCRKCRRCRSENLTCAGWDTFLQCNRENGKSVKGKGDHENGITCITFTIKNVSLCICISEFDFHKFGEGVDYYKYLFKLIRKKKGKKEKNIIYESDPQMKYTKLWLKSYHIYCKQLYNYFMNKIIFETQNDDLHLFNMDIIILQGFDNFLLFNDDGVENKNVLHSNDSFSFDKSVVILNRNKKNMLQKRSYSTLTMSDKNDKLISFGFKFSCDLLTQVGVNMVDDFFFPFPPLQDTRLKDRNVEIYVHPEIIELDSVYTHHIYQVAFELHYRERSSLGSMGKGRLGSMGKGRLGSMGKGRLGSVGKDRFDSMGKDRFDSMGKDRVDSMGKDRFDSMGKDRFDSEANSLSKTNFGIIRKKSFYLHHRGKENLCTHKDVPAPGVKGKGRENHLGAIFESSLPKLMGKKGFIGKAVQQGHGGSRCSSRCGSRSGSRSGGGTEKREVSFSVLCLDSRKKCTVPINLYSYLHLKKMSIFKYLEENMRFKSEEKNENSQSGEMPKGSPARESKNFDILRHVYVHPHKGIIKRNEKKKIKLNLYIERMLREDVIVNGNFILIIRVHNFCKDIFLTIKYSLKNNTISALIQNDTINNSPATSQNRDSGECITIKPVEQTNTFQKKNKLVESKQIKMLKTDVNCQHSRVDTKSGGDPKWVFNDIPWWSQKIIVNRDNTHSFLPSNFTKFVFYSFFMIDQCERELLNPSTCTDERDCESVYNQEQMSNQLCDELFYPFTLSNVSNEHLIYCFRPPYSERTRKNESECDFNYVWKKHFFYVQYCDQNYWAVKSGAVKNERTPNERAPNERAPNDSITEKANYLVGKLKNNEKVEKRISIGTILLLCEELFHILNTSMMNFANVVPMIKNIYNNSQVGKRKKMYLIFYIILTNSPCVLYKNIFLVFVSFLKKMFIYFVCVLFQKFYASIVWRRPQMSKKYLLPKRMQNHYFKQFLNCFHFFHISFLTYMCTSFLSFLDHQIGFDLVHYLLFHL
ncbi:hypothetical protein, conserved [Plasmodium gonderi]|uniref:Uncharacterized protein n=1 Tax=Plasmodium gonderi TaxID=77519 RepID=A0A1Y1JM80_PLAGO|nr:hypothetical protein, conserved [Plasmodium gonderi]GAW82317.1 hypothetical protein, conserved [Plasmodium gonderi]